MKKIFSAIGKFLKKNWRELLGWIAIILFSYLYIFQANSAWWLKGRTYAFPYLLSATVLILIWLRVNPKKQ